LGADVYRIEQDTVGKVSKVTLISDHLAMRVYVMQ